MPKAKPQWGFNMTPSKDVCPHPTEQEIDALIEELSVVLERDLKTVSNKNIKHIDNEIVTFHSFLTDIVTEYRQGFLYEYYYPTKASVKATLEHLQKVVGEVEKRFEPLSLNEGIDEDTWLLLEGNLSDKDEGALGRFFMDSIILRKAIDKAVLELEARDSKTGRKSELKDKVWLTKHIAITFEKILGIKPSKTRGGKFDKTVGKVLKACRLEEAGFIVKGYESEQNFRVIKTALDEMKEHGYALDPWKLRKEIHIPMNVPSLTSGYDPDLEGSYVVTGDGRIYISGEEVKR